MKNLKLCSIFSTNKEYNAKAKIKMNHYIFETVRYFKSLRE